MLGSLSHVYPCERADVRGEVLVRVELSGLDDLIEVWSCSVGAIDRGAAGWLVKLGLRESLSLR